MKTKKWIAILSFFVAFVLCGCFGIQAISASAEEQTKTQYSLKDLQIQDYVEGGNTEYTVLNRYAGKALSANSSITFDMKSSGSVWIGVGGYGVYVNAETTIRFLYFGNDFARNKEKTDLKLKDASGNLFSKKYFEDFVSVNLAVDLTGEYAVLAFSVTADNVVYYAYEGETKIDKLTYTHKANASYDGDTTFRVSNTASGSTITLKDTGTSGETPSNPTPTDYTKYVADQLGLEGFVSGEEITYNVANIYKGANLSAKSQVEVYVKGNGNYFFGVGGYAVYISNSSVVRFLYFNSESCGRGKECGDYKLKDEAGKDLSISYFTEYVKGVYSFDLTGEYAKVGFYVEYENVKYYPYDGETKLESVSYTHKAISAFDNDVKFRVGIASSGSYATLTDKVYVPSEVTDCCLDNEIEVVGFSVNGNVYEVTVVFGENNLFSALNNADSVKTFAEYISINGKTVKEINATTDITGWEFTAYPADPIIMQSGDKQYSMVLKIHKQYISLLNEDLRVAVGENFVYENGGYRYNLTKKIEYAKVDGYWGRVDGQYGVTYYVDGEKIGETTYYSYGDAIPSNDYTPTKDGYSFSGWLNEPSVMGVSDVDVLGSYLPIAYKINYVLNDGSNNELNPSEYSVKDANFELLNADKDGFVFDGWYFDAEYAQKVAYVDTSFCKDITVYAKFIEKSVEPLPGESGTSGDGQDDGKGNAGDDSTGGGCSSVVEGRTAAFSLLVAIGFAVIRCVRRKYEN